MSTRFVLALSRSGLEDDLYFGARQWTRHVGNKKWQWNDYPQRKWTCPLKGTSLYGYFTFQPSIVRGYVSFLGMNADPFRHSLLRVSQTVEVSWQSRYEVWHIENCWNNLHWNSTDDTPDLEKKTFENPIAWLKRLYLYSLVSELCLFSYWPSWPGTIEVGRTVEHRRKSTADEVLHVLGRPAFRSKKNRRYLATACSGWINTLDQDISGSSVVAKKRRID